MTAALYLTGISNVRGLCSVPDPVLKYVQVSEDAKIGDVLASDESGDYTGRKIKIMCA